MSVSGDAHRHSHHRWSPDQARAATLVPADVRGVRLEALLAPMTLDRRRLVPGQPMRAPVGNAASCAALASVVDVDVA